MSAPNVHVDRVTSEVEVEAHDGELQTPRPAWEERWRTRWRLEELRTLDSRTRTGGEDG